jgi:methylenetetrahydrofolate--tRNA-(uracil-5-)-methyltransferase
VPHIHIVGGGLAGTEAAWQALQAGLPVTLHEMRPKVSTPAHKTGNLAELVCSNSMKSMLPHTAPGQLKAEMAAFDSLVIAAANIARVPAGMALAVDREVFSEAVTTRLAGHPLFTRVDEEVTTLPTPEELEARDEYWIVATGPLTSPALAKALEELTGGRQRLYFYDAIAPVLAADSIDMTKAFRASRYGEGEDGDYLNLPLTKDEYEAFIDAVLAAEYMPLHGFEDTKYFEACLPIEVMAERGRETLRFGPMKPVGLTDPKTGRWPWAVVQLRQENLDGTMFSMVGFQTKMKWPEQKRVFGLIPALADAEFLRFGSVHRNTYLKSPDVLAGDLSFKASPRVFLAGQVSGVEGYTESAAIGLLAGRSAAAKAQGKAFELPPRTTMIGALASYVTQGPLGDFSPMNANLGLLPAVDRRKGESKADKKARQVGNAATAFSQYLGRAPGALSGPAGQP